MRTHTLRDGDDEKKKPSGEGQEPQPAAGDYHTGPDLPIPGETDPIPEGQL